MLLVLLVGAKSFCKKKTEFKTALITSFTLLLWSASDVIKDKSREDLVETLHHIVAVLVSEVFSDALFSNLF